jgi:hypothetical protein
MAAYLPSPWSPTVAECLCAYQQWLDQVVYDPKRIKPITTQLGPSHFLVIMPVGSDPLQRREGFEEVSWWGSVIFGGAGILLDTIELLIIAGAPPIATGGALGDLVVAGASSAFSGDMWLPGKHDQPHPDLPSMFLVGQDVLVTAGDLTAPYVVGTGAGALTANPFAGVAAMMGTDYFATFFSLDYDICRFISNFEQTPILGMPTFINAGWSFEKGASGSYILLYP